MRCPFCQISHPDRAGLLETWPKGASTTVFRLWIDMVSFAGSGEGGVILIHEDTTDLRYLQDNSMSF